MQKFQRRPQKKKKVVVVVLKEKGGSCRSLREGRERQSTNFEEMEGATTGIFEGRECLMAVWVRERGDGRRW